jgi:hypothetical protein
MTQCHGTYLVPLLLLVTLYTVLIFQEFIAILLSDIEWKSDLKISSCCHFDITGDKVCIGETAFCCVALLMNLMEIFKFVDIVIKSWNIWILLSRHSVTVVGLTCIQYFYTDESQCLFILDKQMQTKY